MKLIDKAALVAEIEKRYETNMIGAHNAFRNGKIEALREVKDFINTLEVKEVDLKEEPVSDTQPPVIFYGLTGSVGSPKEESVGEDLPHIRHRDTLDEFAYQCAYDMSNDWAIENPTWHDVEDACKLGAKWQKEQDQSTIELAEDHAMLAGMEKMKEEMMAKAIDAHCFGFQGAALFSFRLPASNYLVGSEVKVIVIKED